MMTTNWYVLTTDDGHQYRVYIHFTGSLRKITIQGADLYSTRNEYKGYWPVENWPRSYIKWARDLIWKAQIRKEEPLTDE